MLTVERNKSGIFQYTVSGQLSAEDLSRYYRELEERYDYEGKLRLLAQVNDFRGYADWPAMKVFLRNEHKLLYRVSHYAAVTDQRWFLLLIQMLNPLLPHIELRGFGAGQLSEAQHWLWSNRA